MTYLEKKPKMKAWISRRIGKANIDSVKAVDTSGLVRDGYVRGKLCKVPMFGRSDELLEVTKPITVWKKVRERRLYWFGPGDYSPFVLELTLMPGALIIIHSYESKSRASFAIVQKHDKRMRLYSGWDHTFVYRSDRCVRPRRPFSLSLEACASGIHFFFNKKAAKDYRA
jgi:hypothetical protein